jgi:cytochrome P450
MSEIGWSDGLPATGVPYVDRLAVRAVEIGGCRIEAGQRIRLYLDALKHSQGKDHSLYFGAGRHACLGRVIAQKCWRILTGNLRSIPRTVTIERIDYRPWDGVFNCPISVMVAVGER